MKPIVSRPHVHDRPGRGRLPFEQCGRVLVPERISVRGLISRSPQRSRVPLSERRGSSTTLSQLRNAQRARTLVRFAEVMRSMRPGRAARQLPPGKLRPERSARGKVWAPDDRGARCVQMSSCSHKHRFDHLPSSPRRCCVPGSMQGCNRKRFWRAGAVACRQPKRQEKSSGVFATDAWLGPRLSPLRDDLLRRRGDDGRERAARSLKKLHRGERLKGV